MPDSRWKLVSICTLCGEGDGRRGKAERHQFQHFYPRPPRGGRHWIKEGRQNIDNFYPRPPQGGRRDVHRLVKSLLDNFYPRPPRGGRQRNACGNPCRRTISIHALREEGDGRDLCLEHSIIRFLSTPSARRATSCGAYHQSAHHYFYPRPPRGGRRPKGARRQSYARISIHALREEGDQAVRLHRQGSGYFYPRPPRGGRQKWEPEKYDIKAISIHALREEGDLLPCPVPRGFCHFYPRPPRGGRPAVRATARTAGCYFYPRPPRGGRQQKQRQNLYFLINYTTFCTNLEEL